MAKTNVEEGGTRKYGFTKIVGIDSAPSVHQMFGISQEKKSL